MNIIIRAALRARAAKPKTGGYGPAYVYAFAFCESLQCENVRPLYQVQNGASLCGTSSYASDM